jgi:hypothetical protein
MALRPAESMIVLPVVIFGNGPQAQETLSPRLSPTHASEFKTILDQMATGIYTPSSSFSCQSANTPLVPGYFEVKNKDFC